MAKNFKMQRQGIVILILIMGISFGSIMQINSVPLAITVDPLTVYQVANPDSVYQNDQLNLIVSITNSNEIDNVENVTVLVKIPPELEYISSSIANLEVENDATEFIYDFGTLPENQNINFSVAYNVTSAETRTITLESVNVSFIIPRLNFERDFQITEPIDILLKGERDVTTTESIAPIPSGTISANPIFSIIGYLVPLLAYGMSIIVLRRLRR
ncbi:MAG: hypothetical protein ACFE95_14765 [Candidatus Hodarchaeota archaeon]